MGRSAPAHRIPIDALIPKGGPYGPPFGVVWATSGQATPSVLIDDFGTGYSSLSYLRRFPVDMIKIAKDFVDVDEDDDWAFAHAMVSLGQTLGLQIVAEGVENGRQADRLQRMGCDFAQGYFFARPLRPETMHERISAGLVIPNRTARQPGQPHLVAVPDSLGA